jgi:hypothetical protein
MKMRKKLISGAMALVLLASLPMTSLAADNATLGENGSQNIDVHGTYDKGTTKTVYSVEVSWGSMEFTYSEGSLGTWQPGDHTYSGAAGASWSCEADANKVTVVNHSNAAVTAQLSFDPQGSGVTGDFFDATTGGAVISGSQLVLPSAVDKPLNDATLSASAWLRITSGAISSNGTIGTVTVQLQ